MNLNPGAFRCVPCVFRYVPVCSDTFRCALVCSSTFRCVPFRCVPVRSGAFRCVPVSPACHWPVSRLHRIGEAENAAELEVMEQVQDVKGLLSPRTLDEVLLHTHTHTASPMIPTAKPQERSVYVSAHTNEKLAKIWLNLIANPFDTTNTQMITINRHARCLYKTVYKTVFSISVTSITRCEFLYLHNHWKLSADFNRRSAIFVSHSRSFTVAKSYTDRWIVL